ncbi:outer membrane protein assembly factor BamE domain-containing protein [Rhizobacter fulvus]|jgi:outer membrane protein assembly factor BamE (lipoprotein component of BamABCDE complex)
MPEQHRPGRRSWRTWLAALAAVTALVACDVQKIAELEVGVTTEADVRAKWGEPAAVYTEADGGRTLEYPRQPAGQVNYMLAIGADGKLVAMRQVLKPANFAKIEPGWDKAQVRRLLGLPAKTQRYELKQEEVWDWRFADNAENKQFSVTFDTSGRVTATATTGDPKENAGR